MQARSRTALGALAGLICLVLVAGCSSAPAPVRRTVTVYPSAATTASGARSTAVNQAAPAPATTPAAPHATPKPKPKPKPVNHCAGNTAAQQVIVSLRVQHMWLCAGHRTVRSNAITSGMVGPDTSTPTGNYVIQGRTRDTVLTLNTGATYPVQYWIPFEGPLFGFHDSSWQTFPYGSRKYRTDGSHGCIHMPLAAIAFLYRWSAQMQTAVHIA